MFLARFGWALDHRLGGIAGPSPSQVVEQPAAKRVLLRAFRMFSREFNSAGLPR